MARKGFTTVEVNPHPRLKQRKRLHSDHLHLDDDCSLLLSWLPCLLFKDTAHNELSAKAFRGERQSTCRFDSAIRLESSIPESSVRRTQHAGQRTALQLYVRAPTPQNQTFFAKIENERIDCSVFLVSISNIRMLSFDSCRAYFQPAWWKNWIKERITNKKPAPIAE